MAKRTRPNDEQQSGQIHDLLGGEAIPFVVEHEDMLNVAPVAAPDNPPPESDLFSEPPPLPTEAPPYVVLARRYRPQTFSEIVGQEHVRSSLVGAIESGRIGHAYLFSGPRGTGKTSTARILAKALNCRNGGPRPDPCCVCDSCRSIAAGSSLDVIEIDAASNTGVDNIRDLRTGIVLAPFSRYKVYIIDEVHMLSMQAFNALLKTLEEPPSQVVFVLATTELQKVPDTIVSRCQCLAFRRFTTMEIAEQLARIFEAETKRRALEVSEEDKAKIIDLLARNAEGGMRDAQVALDQVLVLSRGRIDFSSVRRFLGYIEVDVLDEFARALLERRTADLLMIIDQLINTGQDLERFVKNLTEYLRDLLIARTTPENSGLINASSDRLAILRRLAESFPLSFLLNSAQVFLRVTDEMKTSNQTRFILEIAVIKVTQIDPVEDVAKIIGRLQELEQTLNGGQSPSARPPSTTALPHHGASESHIAKPPVPSNAVLHNQTESPAALTCHQQTTVSPPPANDDIPSTPDTPLTVPSAHRSSIDQETFFNLLRERTLQKNHYLHISMLEASIIALHTGVVVFGVNPADRFTYDHLSRPQNQAIIREIAAEILGHPVSIRLQYNTPGPAEIPSGLLQTDGMPLPSMTPIPLPIASTPPQNSAASVKYESSNAETNLAPQIAELATVEPVAVERIYRGTALRKLAEKNSDLADLINIVEKVFHVEDSQLSYDYRT
ncbi:MAG: DNA polymerase III subunit gamma/tau [bacterium]|nr:DNA polymerase III subunit gamma/tau [Candidatus Sumerlaeota bacterium]